MPISVVERPELIFGMYRVDVTGMRLVDSEIDRFFGPENKRKFRAVAKKGEPIPEEARLRVDHQIYGQVGQLLEIGGDTRDWERIWKDAMKGAIATHNYARRILFPDQDRQGTLTTNIDWSNNRPSTALERLTRPTRLIGAQCKYEQGIQLGFGLLFAEVISRDENGNARTILDNLNNFLEENYFAGKSGDPKRYHTFSYHEPKTNRLVDVSHDSPHPHIGEALSVKKLDFPVRVLRVRDETGREVRVPALYEPRQKETEAAVIKAKERSLMATKKKLNGPIETSPYATDQLGVQFVVMEGGRPMRDRVISNLEDLFRRFEGTIDIVEDDQVDANYGSPTRIDFRRRLVYLEGLKNPIEVIVYALEDWIPSEYEVGEYNDKLGMHDGRAHDLYKLMMVGHIAEFLWPYAIYRIPLEETKKASSYEYAARLRRKQRIHPSPYLEEN